MPKRLLLVVVVLAVEGVALVGLGYLGLARLHPVLYWLTALVFLLTFLNEVFSRQTNLTLWPVYLYGGEAGAVVTVLGLIGAGLRFVNSTLLQCGELCQPGNWFWFGLWLAATGICNSFVLAMAEDMEVDKVQYLPGKWVDRDL